MYVTQIELRFPDDQDMAAIRKALVERGPETDNYVGLRFKAYLARERGKGGSTVNEYAPFNVWDDLRGLTYYLWQSEGFGRVLEHFERPPVLGWLGAGTANGPASNRTPTFASRRLVKFTDGADPRTERRALTNEMHELSSLEGVHSVTLGIDANAWSGVLFALWVKEPEGEWADVYTVEHFSMPGIPYDI